ncbi:Hypothetical protein A7982_11392 [Minicystis rosea]|nr:Hypothetical protein A7982_11392 [Minicystis rosea]
MSRGVAAHSSKGQTEARVPQVTGRHVARGVGRQIPSSQGTVDVAASPWPRSRESRAAVISRRSCERSSSRAMRRLRVAVVRSPRCAAVPPFEMARGLPQFNGRDAPATQALA